jgi:hypothetical protein
MKQWLGIFILLGSIICRSADASMSYTLLIDAEYSAIQYSLDPNRAFGISGLFKLDTFESGYF